MQADDRRARGVHLVGSVPLGSAEEVFRTIGPALGDRLRRLRDGETGNRSGWLAWQRPVIVNQPAFEADPVERNPYGTHPRYRLRAGAGADDVQIGTLGYADAARESHALFARLKDEGVIPAHCRFQVCLPPPFAPVYAAVARRDQLTVEPIYEARWLAEVDAILAAIPHDQLAIQWDVCIEMWLWEGWVPAPFADVQQGIVDRLARISARVPADVELGIHLCYGDYGHAHLHEPEDTTKLVEVANAASAAVRRPIQWIHLPVPRDRTDDAYFAPLRDLHLHPETELYLGLVHVTGGVEGTRRRIAAAQRVVPEFGAATECGMGRRPPARGGAPDTFPDLLRLYREVTAPVALA